MKTILIITFTFSLFICGCAKVKLGEPAAFPGTKEKVVNSVQAQHPPLFKNGDIVRYKMIRKGVHGIVMDCNYKYIPRLQTYYLIVDFYPTSVMHFGCSRFDKYERRYVYEYELEKEAVSQVPARWLYDN